MGETDDRADDGQIYVDREKLDVDPSEGLLSGTAIDGTSEIPGAEQSGMRPGPAGEDEGDGGGATEERGGQKSGAPEHGARA